MKFAIVGPDGSGKTSIVNYLHKNLANSQIIYAGKNRNHKLLTTRLSLSLWNLSRQYGGRKASEAIRFLVFYPFEYAENLVRFGANNSDRISLFDRHPVDRMIMLYEYLDAVGHRNVGSGRRNLNSTLLKLLNRMYAYFFIRVDHIFFLLPDARVCFERSKGQYADLDKAKIKIQAYRKAARQLNMKQPLTVLDISAEQTIDEIGDLILNEINLTGAKNGTPSGDWVG